MSLYDQFLERGTKNSALRYTIIKCYCKVRFLSASRSDEGGSEGGKSYGVLDW